jgi:hypothetical protein
MAGQRTVNRLAYGLASCGLVAMSELSTLPASAHEPSHSSQPTDWNAAATLGCYRDSLAHEPSAPQYVRLTLSRARAKARATGPVRILARDGRCLRNTLDLDLRRVNVWLSHGRVIRALRF